MQAKTAKRRRRRAPRAPRRAPVQQRGARTFQRTNIPLRSVAMKDMERKIEAKINDRFSGIEIGSAGMSFLQLLLDPFGQSSTGWQSTPIVCPDGNSEPLLGVTAFYAATMSGATSTSYQVCLVPPNHLEGGRLDFLYGTEAGTPANTPTTVATVAADAAANILAYVAQNDSARIIAAGLRAFPISAKDVTSGRFEAYLTHRSNRTAAAAYQAYGNIEQVAVGTGLAVADGITVRARFDRESEDTGAVAVTQYADWLNLNTVPTLVVTGLSATTVLRVEGVVHMQVRVRPQDIPFPIVMGALEPEFRQIVHFANSEPLITTGFSFAGFFKGVAAGFSKVFRFLEYTVPKALPLLKQGVTIGKDVLGVAKAGLAQK